VTQPLVLILGWARSNSHQLRAYRRFYEDRKLQVYDYTAPTSTIFGASLISRRGRRLLADIADSKAPVLIHLLSDTGFLTYAGMLAHPDASWLSERVNAHVFDSAPQLSDDINRKKYAELFALGILQSNKPGLMRTLVRGFFSIQYYAVARVRRYTTEARTLYRQHAPKVPLLVFYSNDDKMVPGQAVVDFINEEKARGVEVKALHFPGSAHVVHIRSDPGRYCAALAELLEQEEIR